MPFGRCYKICGTTKIIKQFQFQQESQKHMIKYETADIKKEMFVYIYNILV